MHDCSPPTGDRFLARRAAAAPRARARGLLFLTWDEGSSDRLLPALPRAATSRRSSPGPAPARRLSTPVDHYSVLQTIEDLFGLRRLGHAGCACTPSLQPLLK